MMGGQIGVDSVEGKGSCFFFSAAFPHSAARVQADAAAAKDAQSLPTSLAARRALVVDDNQTTRKILCEQLAAWGLDVAEAARVLRRDGLTPRMFFVVPNFQNPTGETLSDHRRSALLALAGTYGAVVVEDDPYGLLRYRGNDIAPMAARDSAAEVVSIGSFSKTFLPGLRVGWVIAGRDTIGRMAAAKQTMDSSTGTLGQRIVLEFERRGGTAAHVAKLREMYRAKQERGRAALEREFAGTGVRWNDPEGGFYFWVRLPKGMTARRLLDVALEEGVAFVPGDAFAIARDHSEALRFSISGPTLDRIDEGVRRLRRAFDRVAS